MNDVAAMAKHKAAAIDACWAGVAPTARAPSMHTKMVDANPTTTAAVAADVSEVQCEFEVATFMAKALLARLWRRAKSAKF